MTLNPEDWSFEKQMKNDPRFVRLEQIQAIMWAFIPQSAYSKGIRESIENFYSGEFIVSNKIENYHKLIKNIEKTISMSDFSGVPIKEICQYDLRNNYSDLLGYYLKMKKLLNHNKEIMEISYLYFYPYILTNSVSNSISSKAKKIRTILASFIDPNKRKFTEDNLIQDFYYPTADLFEIDMDWK